MSGVNIFNNNYFSGIEIYSKGAVALSQITASDNSHGNGAWIDNCGYDGSDIGSGQCQNSSALPQKVTLTVANTFNNNYKSGLVVYTYGVTTITKLTASDNQGIGAYLYNTDSSILAGVTITGWVYVDNDYQGLVIKAAGDITIANLNINQGVDYAGVSLESNRGNVVISGASQIFNCQAYGLQIFTNGGTVTLNNLTVSQNGQQGGVYIDTTHSGSVTTGLQNVVLTGVNTFWNNYGIGLIVQTYGAITISNIDAYNNGAAGVYLDNCGANLGKVCGATLASPPKNISIIGSNFFEKNGFVPNLWDHNIYDGLYALSFGTITISNLHSKDNAGNGAYLNNQWNYASTNGITLTGFNSFEGNGLRGLNAFSHGAISMSNLIVNLNKSDGVWLDNEALVNTKAVSVTLTGVNTFTNNGTLGSGTGLVIFAGGQIILSNITATGNQSAGAYLDNSSNTAALVIKPSVKLTGFNTFNHNIVDTGLVIQSFGAVDLANITANANASEGVYVQTEGTITMTCSSINRNGNHGWGLNTSGLITLKGVFGFGNTNGSYTTSAPVTVRTCPVPAPVIVLPVDDSDKKPHGSSRPALVYSYERK